MNYRDYVWECDYGEHTFILNNLKNILESQNPYQLAYCCLYVNNNPYKLEFYIVFGYEKPVDGQIDDMKSAMSACGSRYRPDLTNNDLMGEMANRRFNSAMLTDSTSIDFGGFSLFRFRDREEMASIISMKPIGNAYPVFLSHSSHDKPFVEDVIPYLTGIGLPVWYDKVNIQYGETIVSKIQEGIVASGAVIFFITYEFVASAWCDKEMEGFLHRFGSGDDVLVLCIVAADIVHEELPHFIQMKKYIRLEDDMKAENVANELLPALQSHLGKHVKYGQ